MGIYVFNTDVMYELLFQDAAKKEASRHDFGQDIIPAMITSGDRVFAYPFRDENRKDAAYWRDVGTLDAYFQTNMDLIHVDPVLNLYDQDWPIHTHQPLFRRRSLCTPRAIAAELHSIRLSARARSFPGAKSTAALFRRACRSIALLLSRIRSFLAEFRWAGTPHIRRAIIDKDVHVPSRFEIGWNRETDLERGFTVTEDGTVVVAKGEDLERFG